MTDLHGSERHYRRAFEAAVSERVDLLLLGGDLCPDKELPTEQAVWAGRVLGGLLADFVAAGGCPVLGVTGNHDTRTAVPVLAQLRGLTLLNGQVLIGEAVDLAGFHLTPPTPFGLKDQERLDLAGDPLPGFTFDGHQSGPDGERVEVTEEAHFKAHEPLERELTKLALSTPGKTVMLAHAPPAGGVLDRLYIGINCGSNALRRYIERTQPLITLHGHVHESPFLSGRCCERIGATWSINPGQDESEPVWAGFDTEDVAGTWRHSAGLPLLLPGGGGHHRGSGP